MILTIILTKTALRMKLPSKNLMRLWLQKRRKKLSLMMKLASKEMMILRMKTGLK